MSSGRQPWVTLDGLLMMPWYRLQANIREEHDSKSEHPKEVGTMGLKHISVRRLVQVFGIALLISQVGNPAQSSDENSNVTVRKFTKFPCGRTPGSTGATKPWEAQTIIYTEPSCSGLSTTVRAAPFNFPDIWRMMVFGPKELPDGRVIQVSDGTRLQGRVRSVLLRDGMAMTLWDGTDFEGSSYSVSGAGCHDVPPDVGRAARSICVSLNQ